MALWNQPWTHSPCSRVPTSSTGSHSSHVIEKCLYDILHSLSPPPPPTTSSSCSFFFFSLSHAPLSTFHVPLILSLSLCPPSPSTPTSSFLSYSIYLFFLSIQLLGGHGLDVPESVKRNSSAVSFIFDGKV